MISAGVEGRLPYMTYPEPWRGPPKQPPELFLRPAPKPLPPTTKYFDTKPSDVPTLFLHCSRYNNGVNTTTYPNGTRLAQPPRTTGKYPSPPSITTPVNLTQTKEEITEDMTSFSPYRLFPPAHQFPHFAYPPYMMRGCFPTTPLSPMEPFSPTTTSSTFLSPPSTFSPPSGLKCGQSLLREKKTSPHHVQAPPTSAAFKIPSGKEGSLKHRILTRPEDQLRIGPLDLQKPPEGRKRLHAALSPPRSPKKPLNNNTLPGSFAKGSLIKLHNGELRRIEDMRTEDFIMSAERSPELRLAESTVVKIEEQQQTGNATITLTYNNRRAQVDMDSSVEHPYFVMGHGWASCDPDRSQRCYGLQVHRLQVGDVLISLTPREPPTPTQREAPTNAQWEAPTSSQREAPTNSQYAQRAVGATVMTTATGTSMTARQVSVNSGGNRAHLTEPKQVSTHQTQPMNLHLPSSYPPQAMSPDSIAAGKRRWSAPDQICDEEEQNNANARRHRLD
ncbi:unnamed protein product [Phaedon cochleariae]|uniref:AXH domain-containing protein n=1 Tax=Phaedon cochleariae TaxID=80249 RepID=A0A9N9SHK9_PHACE|nr:unnamed protein product [Phaedon cochleariae]